TFEIRLTGLGGGVWTVRIADGTCTVREGFAERADVRYTADARVWCSVALGLADAKAVYRDGQMHKDGGREAMDHYFHQIARPAASPTQTASTATDRCQGRAAGGQWPTPSTSARAGREGRRPARDGAPPLRPTTPPRGPRPRPANRRLAADRSAEEDCDDFL